MPLPPRPRRPDPADAVRSILAARALSLAEIARQSRARFPSLLLLWIPPNFYDSLRHASFSPSIHQLYALSVLTGYRLADWLSVFGFCFDDAARFQASLPRHCTSRLDTHVYDPSVEVPWFEEARSISLGKELAPLSRWLFGATKRPLDSLSEKIDASFRYLKIGARDAYAYPDLLPGSVVRIASRIRPDELLAEDTTNRILAVAHGRGVLCGRVRRLARGRIVLCSRQLPYAPMELALNTEAEILGYVDMEIRRVEHQEAPEVHASWRQPKPRDPRAFPQSRRLGELVRRARVQSGLSLREASAHTAEIARVLRHPNYFCAPGTLSDLEARDGLPRHIHKLVSLSGLYSIPVAELLDRAGLPLNATGKNPFPTDWRYGSHADALTRRTSPLLKIAEQLWEELPFFLWRALPILLGLPKLSIRDLFWAGATAELVHPYLRGTSLLAVNRMNKSPAPSLASPVWAQPLYVLELRDGQRLCAPCNLQDGTLVVKSCTTVSGGLLRLRYPAEVEIIGKVTAIVRLL